MYYTLRRESTLALKEGQVALTSENADLHIPLSQVTALVLNFFDGSNSVDDIAHLLQVVLAQEPAVARTIVEETAWRYKQFITAHPEKFAAPKREQPLNPMMILTKSVREKPWRAAAPGGLDWLATYQCNRRCIYCYRDAPLAEKVTDLYLTTDDLFHLLDQGKAVGVRDFLVNGGEPFFRRDTIQVIDYAHRCGMWVKTYTKWHFTREAAEQLCRHGRPRVYFSLDTLNANTNLFLTGSRTHLEEAVDSIKNLLAAGADVFVTPVVTRFNLGEVPQLIETVSEMGVSGIRLAPFTPGLRRWRDDLDLLPEQMEQLRGILSQYAQLLEDDCAVQERIRALDHNPLLPTEMKTSGCANGLTSLTIHPTGDASLCDKFVDERLMVGNIKRQSLMEIWNSTRMYEVLLPSELAYAGTACSGCSGFDGCNKRGRCYYSSLLASGSIFGPDDYCQREDYIPLHVACN